MNESLLWLGTSQDKCDYERDVSMSNEDFELLDAAVYRWVPLGGVTRRGDRSHRGWGFNAWELRMVPAFTSPPLLAQGRPSPGRHHRMPQPAFLLGHTGQRVVIVRAVPPHRVFARIRHRKDDG